ncbi:MAG: acetate kinase [Hormoscilla sp. SP5CHS1]|nr:acetate kinase [Hormoscilla sp. SP12CHS1]MBC6452829.1 acetate kinase [Hormoscilla sp. SP5CHS1]
MKILVLNAGSSSQKSCLYETPEKTLPQESPEPLWEANIDWSGSTDFGTLKVKAKGVKLEVKLPGREGAIAQMLETLSSGKTRVLQQLSEIDIVGHRVVHGGAEYSQATLITPAVKEAIARLVPLAPSHNPAHLEGIEAIEKILGKVPQVAVFDTAFHSQMPKAAVVYPIPYEWFEQGIRRYGFHGTSHKYASGRAAQILRKPLAELRLIACHLGNGCSLTAVKNGVSIDTTMGFTPLEGLMMGTRSGSIDPAIVIYLMRKYNYDADKLDKMLNKASGLKGIMGKSGDMRHVLQAIGEGDEQAQLAFDMYVHRLRASIGSMVASLGGLEAIVFTAGVGENAAAVREATCAGLEFLGLKLDKEKNLSFPKDMDIATPDSAVRVLVVQTAEDWAIACECWYLG